MSSSDRPHTAQKVGEFHRVLPRERSKMMVPRSMSVKREPEPTNDRRRLAYWASTKKLEDSTPV
jgi:hypothetical protein